MLRAGNMPNYNLGAILSLDQVGVIWRNIAIFEAVDQQHRNVALSDRMLWRSFFHI